MSRFKFDRNRKTSGQIRHKGLIPEASQVDRIRLSDHVGIDNYQVAGEPIRDEKGPLRRNDPCPCESGLKFKRCCGGGLS